MYPRVFFMLWLFFSVTFMLCLEDCRRGGGGGGELDHLLPKFEHIFVAVIIPPPFLLCRYFYYQLVG